MTILHHEIMEQPEALSRLLTQESSNIQQVATAIHKRSPRYVMIAARGSSDNAARYAQYLFGAHNRLPVALATPSLFTLYQTPPDLQDALVLAVSQSGQSPDICAVVEEGRRQGALTITLTNDATSPLANLAELCIQMHAGPEKAIAATKTYTNSLLAIAMLSCALTGVKEHQDALQGIPEQVTWTLRQDKSIIEAAKQYRQEEACVTMGRGYNFSTAFELALKLKELDDVISLCAGLWLDATTDRPPRRAASSAMTWSNSTSADSC